MATKKKTTNTKPKTAARAIVAPELLERLDTQNALLDRIATALETRAPALDPELAEDDGPPDTGAHEDVDDEGDLEDEDEAGDDEIE